MKNLEELKQIKICNCTNDELSQLKEDVLSLNREEIKDFILNILDNQYDLNYSRKENVDLDYDEEKMENFLKDDVFVEYHKDIIKTISDEKNGK